MTDIANLTIAEIGRLYRSRALSPVAVVDTLLDRIARIDPHLNAFLQLDAEAARQQAAEAEAAFSRGEFRGPMHGIPYAAKDNIDVRGLATTCNSKILVDAIAASDAFVIARLRAAGGILIGKAALHEFAKGGAMNGLPWPPARNPWNRARHPGGSSSGSGAALAARMIPAAIGTDTGGSVRHPATVCGVVGMKPTYGAISRSGVFPLAFSLDAVGPMTRTVEDNAILFEAMQGYDPADPSSARRDQGSCLETLRDGVRGLRVGVIEHFYQRDMRADESRIAAIDMAMAELRRLGAEVETIVLSPLSVWSACGQTILDAESFAIHEEWLLERPQDYSPTARGKLLVGGFISSAKYIRAQQMRTLLCRELRAAMQDFDVLVTMSSMEAPCAVDDDEEIGRTYGRHARMPFNVAGVPALSVPIGFDENGLPIGMQIVGKAFDEAMVYRAAWAYCEATPWMSMRPPEPS